MSLGISTRRFLRVSLTSVRSVFIWTSSQRRSPAAARRSDLAVHLRAPRYGGHSFACQCSHSEAPTFALHASVGNARERTGSEGVRKGGVEPPKPFGYRILSPARLPVPPLSRQQIPMLSPSFLGDRLPDPDDFRCGVVDSIICRSAVRRLDIRNQVLVNRSTARGLAVHGTAGWNGDDPKSGLPGARVCRVQGRN